MQSIEIPARVPRSEKWLWAMRHGDNVLDPDIQTHGMWQPESPLSAQGAQQVEATREKFFRGRHFTHLHHSPFTRARQTAFQIVPSGDWRSSASLAPRLRVELDELYKRLAPAEQPNTLDGIELHIPGFCKVEGGHIEAGIIRIMEAVEFGESAIVVTHQPLLGLLRGRLNSSFGPHDQTLPKGGVYLFRFTRSGQPSVDTLL